MSEATTNAQGLRLSQRRRRALIWAGLGLVVLVVGGLIAVFGPNRNAAPETFSNKPAKAPVKEVDAKLPPEALAVARRFVQTAVARKNLAEAWDLAGPNVRGGLTRAQWLTGSIPVVPFPLGHLDKGPFKIDYSHESDALLEVALLAKPGSGTKSQIFFLNLKKIGAAGHEHWVVDNWVPRASALVPTGDNG